MKYSIRRGYFKRYDTGGIMCDNRIQRCAPNWAFDALELYKEGHIMTTTREEEIINNLQKVGCRIELFIYEDMEVPYNEEYRVFLGDTRIA